MPVISGDVREALPQQRKKISRENRCETKIICKNISNLLSLNLFCLLKCCSGDGFARVTTTLR